MEQEERLKAALADRYSIDRVIGEGGMATVYLATDLRHERKVALKVLRADLAASLGAERFLQEVRVTANLQHPHILPLFDSGEADGFLFYVMPYVEGESLRQRLVREHELPVPEVARLLRDVVDALAAAHKLGVVHRDIKPENVLLSGRHALVADFGVAKAVSEATGRHKLTTLGVALGTPSYMAPEQAAADEAIDHRADLYAVGVMAYELLAGRPPFTGSTPQQVLAAQVMDPPRPVTELRASVPPALETLVMRCLEKKPADRWQSAEEMLPHLEAAATPSGGITPTDMQPVTLPFALIRRRSLAWVAGAVALAVMAAGYFLFFRDTQPTIQDDLIIVFPLDNQTGDPSLDYLGNMAADMIVEGLGWVAESRTVAMTEVREAVGAGSLSHREIATDLQAAVLISGSYSRRGDSLVFRAEGTDVATGAAIAQVGTAALSDQATPALEELRSRIAGGAASGTVDPAWSRVLPTFEAGVACREASERFAASDWEGAGERYLEAYDLDTTYLLSLVEGMISYSNRADHATIDSLLAILAPRRTELGTLGSLSVAQLVASHEGDLRAFLEAERSIVEADTANIGSKLNLSIAALQTGRPSEALAVLESIDPDQLEQLSAASRPWYWTRVSEAHRWIGDHREALDAARRGKTLVPESLRQRQQEILALVALDRLEEIDPLLDDVERMEPPEDGSQSPGSVYRAVAAQLFRWGHEDRARAVAERAVDWYRARDPDRYQRATAQALLLADRPQEAAELLESLVLEEPENRTIRGTYGRAVAQSGDHAEAEAVAAWFEALDLPYLFGADSYWQAVILAHLGRAEEAVRLLRQAFEGGSDLWDMRWDEALLPLWEDEGFQQLVAPRG